MTWEAAPTATALARASTRTAARRWAIRSCGRCWPNCRPKKWVRFSNACRPSSTPLPGERTRGKQLPHCKDYVKENPPDTPEGVPIPEPTIIDPNLVPYHVVLANCEPNRHDRDVWHYECPGISMVAWQAWYKRDPNQNRFWAHVPVYTIFGQYTKKLQKLFILCVYLCC